MTNFIFKDNRYIVTAYRSVIYLALLYHVLFACLIAGFHFPAVLVYYLGVCVFYVAMLQLVKKNKYRLATVLVHMEIISFMVVNTILFGWNAGFHAFLLALASLVYFNPFENAHVR